jgi:hypothetical protein
VTKKDPVHSRRTADAVSAILSAAIALAAQLPAGVATAETVRHRLRRGIRPSPARAGLIVHPAGALYGTSQEGGEFGRGTVLGLSAAFDQT